MARLAVTAQLLPRLAPGSLVLDLGCGYGRIRRHVAETRPDLRVIGTDFSEGYCRMHARRFMAETVCADMHYLPFPAGTFDGMIGVTCLMYLDPAERPRHIEQVLGLLKPSGHALFVEPGLEFMRLARFSKRSTRRTPTGGEGYTLADYSALDASGRLRTHALGGVPLFTALLPLLFLIHRRATGLTEKILSEIRHLDFTSRVGLRYTLQRWVLLGPR
jgi:SAM-dependent methyltransferase